MTSAFRTYPLRQRWIVGLLIALIVLVPNICRADRRSAPAWFDTNGLGRAPDWHCRAPIATPSGTAINSAIRIDVDFDTASPRIVRSNGTAATTQQFSDSVYMGATDAIGDSQGEVRFILEV